MAAEGFLTSVYADSKDVLRPTFFELVAQEQLMGALKPAVRFIVGVYAERAPPVLLPLFARWEAIYHALLLLLEGFHLRVHGASFAEHFFGLRRQEQVQRRKLSPLEAVELERRRQTSPGLARRQQLLSMVLLVLLPWLRSKCKACFQEAEGTPTDALTRWQRRWLRLYPWVHALSHGAAFAYRVRYLMGRTDVYSPGLELTRLRLVRQIPEPPPDPLAEEKKGLLQRLLGLAGSAASASLWGGVYGMQFLQWWFQREHLLQPYQARLVPPPPPLRDPYRDVVLPAAPPGGEKAEQAAGAGAPRLVLLPQDRTVCALCHRARRNPAMSTSGFVFCYTCILPHVQRYGHCPVTGVPMTAEQVRRIRED